MSRTHIDRELPPVSHTIKAHTTGSVNYAEKRTHTMGLTTVAVAVCGMLGIGPAHAEDPTETTADLIASVAPDQGHIGAGTGMTALKAMLDTVNDWQLTPTACHQVKLAGTGGFRGGLTKVADKNCK